MEVLPVAEEERDFHEDEERGRQQGLVEAVQQGWSPAFEDSVADELEDPGNDVDNQSNLPHGVAVKYGSCGNLQNKILRLFEPTLHS